MAAKYRKIDPRIWCDEKFAKLNFEGKLLAFWLLTNSRLNRIGVVLWSPGLASEETGIDGYGIDTVCHTVCHTLNWVFEPASKVVFLTSWWKYNAPDNEKAMQGALDDLHDLPRNELKPHILKASRYLRPTLSRLVIAALDTVYDTVCHTVCHTVSPQKQEQKQEQEQEKKSKAAASPLAGGLPSDAGSPLSKIDADSPSHRGEDTPTTSVQLPFDISGPISPNLGESPPENLGSSNAKPDASELKRPKLVNFDPLKIELPFASAQFADTWAAWCRHRAGIKKKLSHDSVRLQMIQFRDWGEARSIAAIEHSIRNGWQGIFEPPNPNQSANGRTAYKTKREKDDDFMRDQIESLTE